MAAPLDSGGKDEVKTQFATREGTYRLMALSEYSRPNRVGYTSAGGAGASPVRVSLVSLPAVPAASASAASAADGDRDEEAAPDRICFNHGKELYVYVYRGIKKAADLTKPVDKRMYKGTNPTCHDFNTATATHDSVALLIGFSTGQIQLIDPIRKEISKLFNEERVVDKTRVTCIRWVPGATGAFVAAHASGALYEYEEALGGGGGSSAQWARLRAGAGFAVCAAAKGRNPVRRWRLGAAATGSGGGGGSGACVNEFSWSPCGARLATAGQDGYLRVFQYAAMVLEGRARSYFGGFLCVAWSGDGRLVAVGGEDDLVTLWSAAERRVAARLQGHRSWVAAVAFDPFAAAEGAYRLGSVGQDTQLCLWDLAEDALRPPPRRAPPAAGTTGAAEEPEPQPPAPPLPSPPPPAEPLRRAKREDAGVGALTARLAGFSFGERRPLGLALGRAPGDAAGEAPGELDPLRLMGTALCPRFDEVPVLEPLVVKRIAHERLTALLFRADCFLTACADGCVNTWARPQQRPQPPPPPPAADHRDTTNATEH